MARTKQRKIFETETLPAKNEAFRATVVAGSETWDFRVETTPLKFVTLMKTFVDAHIFKDGISKEEFLSILLASDRRHWATTSNGMTNLILR